MESTAYILFVRGYQNNHKLLKSRISGKYYMEDHRANIYELYICKIMGTVRMKPYDPGIQKVRKS